eukprot:11805326-Alexandrium_andersonii.AAC.1
MQTRAHAHMQTRHDAITKCRCGLGGVSPHKHQVSLRPLTARAQERRALCGTDVPSVAQRRWEH